MPNHTQDPLFQLIKTLTKAEKRNFRLFVNRVQNAEDILFVQLFDVLDKAKKYNESVIFSKIPQMKRSQLSNLKRHLYKQILASLRIIMIHKDMEIKIQEQLDFAKILYLRGLYLQALKILERIKLVAQENHQDILHLKIIEFEKLIESRHITRSLENRADQLSDESRLRTIVIKNTAELSNLALRLYGLFLKVGHVRNPKDKYFIDNFFQSNLPPIQEKSLTFFEKIYYRKALVWYNFILLNFPQCYKNAQLWVNMFEQYPQMKQNDPILYLRGINNLMAAAVNMNYYSKLVACLQLLEDFEEENKNLDTNTLALLFLYKYSGIINKHFLEGSFEEGLKLIPELESKISSFKGYMDRYRILIFQYKIACLYFGNGDYSKAIDYLNDIINAPASSLREDLQSYARILHLIAHYELCHFDLLEYLVKSVYRFLLKRQDLNQVLIEILKFLRHSIHKSPENLHMAFVKLRQSLKPLENSPYESKSFLYLDIISWLDSKIENRPVKEIMAAKFAKSHR